MRAAVLREFRNPLEMEERAAPAPGPGEIQIRVHACGLCHSDVHLADADWDSLVRAMRLPLILGHEVAGAVEAAGPGVAGWRAGDRAGVPWLNWSCGVCAYCLGGDENLCLKQKITGVTVDGGFAEIMTAPASHAIRIPEGVALDEAAPLFCAGLTAYRALRRSGLAAGQRVAVFGAGGLGHMAIQIARAWNADVCAVDSSEERLAHARKLGAGHTLHSSEDPKSLRADVAVVTTAAPQAYPAAARSLRRGGTLMVAGMPAGPLQFPVVPVVGGELRILGSAVGTRQDMRELLEMAARGQVKCQIQSRPLDQINESIADLRSGRVTGRLVLKP
jgi:propanol-preferring alcohol dehydrogenase